MRLMWVPLYSKLQMVLSRECCRRFSWGSKSETVVPRARLPRLRVAPACSSSVSTSEVLPAPACPTSAMLRMPEVVYPMTVAPPAKETGGARATPASESLLRQTCRRLPERVPCPHEPCPWGPELAGVHND